MWAAPTPRGLTPFVVATAGLGPRLNFAPLERAVDCTHRFDPTKTASRPLLDGLERLDRVTFGTRGLAMPRWAFYDCVELPGFVFGFGRDAGDVEPPLRSKLGIAPDSTGFVPLSMVLAIPMLEADHWFVHSVAALDGSPIVALASALDVVQARRVTGITQWSSDMLSVHARFAPLEIRSAWTLAHSDPATCVFRYEVSRGRIAEALEVREKSPADRWIDPLDRDALRALQSDLEAEVRADIAGPAVGARFPLLGSGDR